MFGNRNEAGIHHRLLRSGRAMTADQKPEVIGEIDLSDQIIHQIMPAHGDAMGIRRGDGGEGIVLLADPHFAYPFRMAKIFSLAEQYGAH
jgi:hypothetical protein